MFRVDGDIATDDWSQIVALWFRGNNLATGFLDDLADTTTVDGAASSGSLVLVLVSRLVEVPGLPARPRAWI